MNVVLDKLDNRLKSLMGDISFKWDERCLESPVQLMATCTHNSREYGKYEAMNLERQERIWNLFSHMLAVELQELAMDQYGNTDEESIRKVLNDLYKVTDSQEYWNRIMRLTKEYFLGIGLKEKQIQAIMGYFDTLPMVMIDFCIDLTEQWNFLPAKQAQSIASALTDLIGKVAA
jgi:hypothetical protein